MKVNRLEKQKGIDGITIVWEWVNNHLVKVFLFVLSMVYFFGYGSYILSFQEGQSLFLYTYEYLSGFLNKPGGLLVYAAKFLTVFYSNTFTGAFLLASIITLHSYLFGSLCRLLPINSTYCGLFSVLTSCCLLILQSHYYHFLEINLGFLLVTSFLILSVWLNSKKLGFITLVLFPFFYFLAGAFGWLFFIVYLIYLMTSVYGNRRFIESGILVVLAALVLFVSEKWVFIQPRSILTGYPVNLINDSNYRLAFYVMVGCFPSIVLLAKFKFQIFKRVAILSVVISYVFLFASGLILYWTYNPQTARVLQVEKLIFEEKWDDAIRFSERNSTNNLVGQYFYNVALSETGQLCDKLFSGRQNLGVNSLILPWGNEHLSYGALFYYSVGLINEAHRWAYEDMVVNGFKPSNLKMLIKANLINEDYAMALKYISILKKSHNYRKWAMDYERMVVDTGLIAKNAEIKYRRSIMPKGDFFIQVTSPQNNIPLLLNSNPTNKRAFEYKMAWLMLSKDIEGITSQLKELKNLGYTRIPRHLEEAVMIYYNAKDSFPEMGGLSVSEQTMARFNQYVDAFKANRQNIDVAKQTLGTLFGDTFMYYYHFR